MPVVLAIAWGALVLVAVIASANTGAEIKTCHFLAATDVPCATCGGTRAALALFGGNIGGALHHNPLITLTLLLGLAAVALRVVGGRQIVCKFSRRGWTCFTLFLIMAVALNWYYVAHINPAY